MSIDYQFSAMPAEWLLTNIINPTDKFILAVLILKSNENANHVYKQGFDVLSMQTGISRRQCIYITNKLKTLRFIEINNHTRPVEIRVCLEFVGGQSQGAVKSATDCTLYHAKSAIDCTNRRDKECNLVQERVQFDARKSATDCTHNRYLDFSRNTRASAHEEKATADVAAVRSMLDAGQAGENTQQSSSTGGDLAAKTLFSTGFNDTFKLFLETYKEANCDIWYFRDKKLLFNLHSSFLERYYKPWIETYKNWWSEAGVELIIDKALSVTDEKIDRNLILKGA